MPIVIPELPSSADPLSERRDVMIVLMHIHPATGQVAAAGAQTGTIMTR